MADHDFGFIGGYRRGIVQVSHGFFLRKDSLDIPRPTLSDSFNDFLQERGAGPLSSSSHYGGRAGERQAQDLVPGVHD